MMKTMLAVLGVAFTLFANGTAHAIPMTWTDVYTPVNAPILFNADNPGFAWTFDLTDDGWTVGDTITDYTITLNVFDDQDTEYEFATFIQPGVSGTSTFPVDYTDVSIGMTLLGSAMLNQLGILEVQLSQISGDFFFGGATLVANGESTLLVPEPSTLALLLAGLFFGFGRRGTRQ